MILKCKSIAHIHNSIGYILKNEKNHELIDFNGVDISNQQNIISDFGFYKNPKVSNSYVSLVISPSPDDALDAEKFKQIVAVTLKELKLDNRQFFAVSHNNTKTPHCHVILNRISYNQETWNDHHIAWKCKEASIQVAKKLNLKSAGDREKVLKSLRVALRYEVREVLKDARSLKDFQLSLEKREIQTAIDVKKNGSVGLRLSYKGESFKASEVDRSISYIQHEGDIVPNEKLESIFKLNDQRIKLQERFSKNISNANYDDLRKRFNSSIHFCTTVEDILEDLKKAGVSVLMEIGNNENLVLQLSYKGEFLTSQDLSPMLKFKKEGGVLKPSKYLEQVLQNTIDRFDNKRTEIEILADMGSSPDRKEDLSNEMLTWFNYKLKQGLPSFSESQKDDDDDLNMRIRRRKKQNNI